MICASRRFTKACQGEGTASPAVTQGVFSFLSTLWLSSFPWMAECLNKGPWERIGLESQEDAVGNVGITFIFKMLTKLTMIFGAKFC